MKNLLGSCDIASLEVTATTGGLTTSTKSIDMQNYRRCLVLLRVTDGGTGTVVTLKQGTTYDCSTALKFDTYYKKADITTSNVWTRVTGASDTFTTGTASKTGLYAIDVDGQTLTDGYRYLRCNCATAASATEVCLTYIPYDPRFAERPDELLQSQGAA